MFNFKVLMLKIYKSSCPNKRLWMSIERLSSGDKMTMMVVEVNGVEVIFVVDIRQLGSASMPVVS